MGSKRLFVYSGLMMAALLLWQAWQEEHSPAAINHQTVVEQGVSTTSAIPLPEDMGTEPASTVVKTPATKSAGSVRVVTDTLEVRLGLLGGNVNEVKLNDFTLSLQDKTLETVLSDHPKSIRSSQSGLEGAMGPDNAKSGQAIYTAEKTQYSLAPGQDKLMVNLKWHSHDGVKITKHLLFKRGSYAIQTSYTVNNTSPKAWKGRIYLQLKSREQEGNGMFGMRTYAGNAISSPETKYEKLSFSDLKKQNLDRDIRGGWLASQEHYFIAAWVPEKDQLFHYYSFVSPEDDYVVGLVGNRFALEPGQKITTPVSSLYAGPEEAHRLEALAPGSLKLTIDYGRFWVISAPIFWVLQKLHQAIGNWGWAIIAITMLMKMLFYRLSEKSYRSMAKMRLLQPKLESIKSRCGDDKAKMSQETMALYQKEKVNPLGGCLPMVVQIPIFLALYWVLIESVELRQAPFIFWIHDLSVKDPFYVLPILMGVSMFFQQHLNPKPQDPMQAKVMMFLPVMMTGLFVSFPAGLVLYWLSNNVLSILQQWMIMKRVNAGEA